MITFFTPNGDKWTCVRVNHNHNENGRNVPCMACRRVQTARDRNQAQDTLRSAAVSWLRESPVLSVQHVHARRLIEEWLALP